MWISNLKLKNWRNFTQVDVDLQRRQFLVGPNASGKSNFLDVFRFLRDVGKQKGGGLQDAIEKRGGMSKIRCLSARRDTEVSIEVSISESKDDPTPKWRYAIGIKIEQRGHRQPYVSYENVWENGKKILDRKAQDETDRERLQQTYLEQVNNNREFREIGKYLDKITYMHLVPQLLRHSDDIQGRILEDDPFGQGFLENMAKTNKRTRDFRLRKINEIMKYATPRLENINFVRDQNTGRPHITAKYKHWRKQGALQSEEQFSDGTLRLMALIWSLLDGDSLLLLEEPELSLHSGIVENLAEFLYRAQQRKNRQILISTHSSELLSNEGIGLEEVLLLTPTDDGNTKIKSASHYDDIKNLLIHTKIPVSEVVIAHTKPSNFSQQDLLGYLEI